MSVISFSDADLDPHNNSHNRSFYLTALVNGSEVKRALVDGGSSINVMPLETMKAARIPQERIIKQVIEIAGFATEGQCTLRHIIVDLEVG